MYIIGLTGNIATGKSTVAAMLKTLGACGVDADELAHWTMRSGTQVNRLIVARFGAAVQCDNGEIDRTQLGPLVFSDVRALRDLEAIVHPAVIEETWRRLEACDRAVGVVEAIKLIEAGMHRRCAAVWVVICPREQQLERLMRTRGLTLAQADLRIAVQPPAEEKLALADVVIDNARGLDETWTQVMRAWNAIPGAARVPADAPRPALGEKGRSQ